MNKYTITISSKDPSNSVRSEDIIFRLESYVESEYIDVIINDIHQTLMITESNEKDEGEL